MQEVCCHRRSGGLTMRTCHTESLVRLCQEAQHLCTFLNFKSILTEIDHFLVLSRNGWCIDHQSALLLLEARVNSLHILLVMNLRTLLYQLFRQLTWCLVITTHVIALGQEITNQRAHANATSTYKIHGFHLCRLHHFCLFLYSMASLYTSSAITSAELCRASIFTFSLNDFSFSSSTTVLSAMSIN